MTYYTGAADSAAGLLSQLKALLPQQGWSVVRDDDLPDGNYGVILQGADGYFRLAVPEAGSGNHSLQPLMQAAQTYSAGTLVDSVGSQTYKSGSQTASYAPFVQFPGANWHLFIGDRYFYLVIESPHGQFSHLSVGRLDLVGGLGGGWFASGVFPQARGAGTSIQRPIYFGMLSMNRYQIGTDYAYGRINSGVLLEDPDTGVVIPFFPGSGGTGSGAVEAGRRPWYIESVIPANPPTSSGVLRYHPDRMRLWASADSRTGITRLFPMTILWGGAQNRLYYIGEVPGVAVCMLDFVQAGQVITVDGEDWMVFPRRIRDLGATVDRTGYAYRVN